MRFVHRAPHCVALRCVAFRCIKFRCVKFRCFTAGSRPEGHQCRRCPRPWSRSAQTPVPTPERQRSLPVAACPWRPSEPDSGIRHCPRRPCRQFRGPPVPPGRSGTSSRSRPADSTWFRGPWTGPASRRQPRPHHQNTGKDRCRAGWQTPARRRTFRPRRKRACDCCSRLLPGAPCRGVATRVPSTKISRNGAKMRKRQSRLRDQRGCPSSTAREG
mmetsp:Transcript_660/g.1392  ORF Transcript_660/g.1392 Transcript_660/m.1392 type:complete len:216 (-) Transcript_660:410-1057(-)